MAYYLKSKEFENVWFYNPQKCKGSLFDQFKALLGNEEKPNWDFINLDKIKPNAYPTPFEDYEIPESGAFSIFEFDKLTDVSFYVCRDGEWGAYYEDFRGYTRLGWFSSNEDADPIEPCELGRVLNSYNDVQIIPTYTIVQKPLSKERLEEIKAFLGFTPKPEPSQTEIEYWKQQFIPQEYLNPQYSTYQSQPQYPAHQSKTKPQTSQDLLERLRVECPDLLKLVKSPPIRLVGQQRTGKSTFARKLVLLRTVLLPGHKVAWATPHTERDNPVPKQLHPFGTHADGSKNFPAIENVWCQVQSLIDKGQVLNTSLVWDEFGSYDQFSDDDLLKKSLKSLLREASKHEYYPILVAHGDQANFYPGVTGILTTLQQSTVKVETIGKQADEFGTMRPTGEVMITWLDGSQTRFKVPDWLTVDLLLKLQPPNTRPPLLDGIGSQPNQNHHQPYSVPASQPTNVVQFPQQQNGELYRAIQYANEKASEIVPYLKPLEHQNRADLIYLVALAAQRSPIDAAKVSQFLESKPFVKAISGFPNKNDLIRNMLIELQQLGYGECFGYGSSLKFSFKADGRKIG